MSIMNVWFLLVLAHLLCDYPLQGPFLSEAKNRFKPIPGVPWGQAMGAHCSIHACMVALITGIWWLFIVEFVIHYVTDDLKCGNKINLNTEQFIHISCKFIYLLIYVYIR